MNYISRTLIHLPLYSVKEYANLLEEKLAGHSATFGKANYDETLKKLKSDIR